MALIYKEKTDFGKIVINEDVIINFVVEEIKKYYGRLFLKNSKGQRTPKVYQNINNIQTNSITIESIENSIEIKIDIVAKFGISIKTVTEELIENIRARFEEVFGINPKSITVKITGVLSKKIAKRDIEVSKSYDE